MAPNIATPQVVTSTLEASFSGCGDARPRETAHAFLRRATRQWHEDVEGAFARFDLQTSNGVAGFLVRQAMALFPLEQALERAGIAERIADWPARRRSTALATDLAQLGVRVPRCVVLPHIPGPAHALGALYVLEGSKLGGRVLHRQVMASPDPRVRAAGHFLAHRQDRGWASFLQILDAVETDPATLAGLRQGAFTAFACFAAAGRDDGAVLLHMREDDRALMTTFARELVAHRALERPDP